MSDKKTKIQVRDLDLFYASNHALKKINIDIKENEVTALIGPQDVVNQLSFVL